VWSYAFSHPFSWCAELSKGCLHDMVLNHRENFTFTLRSVPDHCIHWYHQIHCPNFTLLSVFCTEYVGMFMTNMGPNYLHTKFHILSTSGSLFIAVKPKGKCGFCMAAMLFCMLQKIILKF